MYAYAPDGTAIKSRKEMAECTCDITQGTFSRQPDGDLEGDYNNGTTHDYDSQHPVIDHDQPMFYDTDGEEWPACAIILLEQPLDEELGLPADLVAEAEAKLKEWQDDKAREANSRRYVISPPTNGWRAVNSFTPEECALLRPIAEILAMLDGNAFFGIETDENGDDIHYRQYLPEAHELFESNNGWSLQASFIRGNKPLQTGMPGTTPVNYWEGNRIVDLVDFPTAVIHIIGIDWDISSGDDEDNGELTPALPSDLYAGVPSDWGDDNRFIDLLSDRYGFCINGVKGSVTELGPYSMAQSAASES